MSDNPSDPMNFLKNLWGGNGFALPGMVAPTLDTDDLDKRITDLKTVEGWLRTNLSMLSMTIQNLEMQHSTVTAMRTMSQMYADQGNPGATAEPSPETETAGAAMWPWTLMQQMQTSMQEAAAQAQENVARSAAAASAAASAAAKKPAAAPKSPSPKAAAAQKSAKDAGKSAGGKKP